MEKKTLIVGLLVIAVIAAFVMFPQLRGQGSTGTLSILPPNNTSNSLPTEISCSAVNDCVAYAQSHGATGTIKATCDAGKCVFYADKLNEVAP